MLHVYPLVVDIGITPPVSEFNLAVPRIFNTVIPRMLEEQVDQRDISAGGALEALRFLEPLCGYLRESLCSLKQEILYLLHDLRGAERYPVYIALPWSWLKRMEGQRVSDTVTEGDNPGVTTVLLVDFKCLALSEVMRLGLIEVGEWRRYSSRRRDPDPLYSTRVMPFEKGRKLLRWLWHTG